MRRFLIALLCLVPAVLGGLPWLRSSARALRSHVAPAGAVERAAGASPIPPPARSPATDAASEATRPELGGRAAPAVEAVEACADPARAAADLEAEER